MCMNRVAPLSKYAVDNYHKKKFQCGRYIGGHESSKI